MTGEAIVVGLDLRTTPAHQELLRRTAEYAARLHAPVHLVHGLSSRERTRPLSPADVERLSGPAHRRLQTAAREIVDRVHGDLRVTTEVSPSTGSDALLAAAAGARVVIVERRDRGPRDAVPSRSTTVTVIARSSCPVLVVRELVVAPVPTPRLRPAPVRPGPVAPPAWTASGVVVAVDGHGHSRLAIEAAFQEATWRGVPLVAVHAYSPVPRRAYDVIVVDEPELHAARDDAEELVSIALAGIRDRFPDVPVTLRLVRDRPGPALVQASVHAELVVLARNVLPRRPDPTPHRSPAVGGVVRGVLDGARSPVLVVAGTVGPVAAQVRPWAEVSR